MKDHPTEDKERDPAGADGTILENADRKGLEESLRIERDLLKTLFDNLMVGITVWSREGLLLQANHAFTELTGYTAEDIRCLDDWFQRAYPDPEYRKAVLADLERSPDRKATVKNFSVTCKTGELKEIEFRASSLDDDRALVTLTDINDRKLAEEKIRQSESRFRATFRSAPVGMAIIDLQRRFVEVNDQICNALGYRAEELLGRSFNDFTHIEDRDGGRERWQKLLSGEVTFNQAEKRYIHKDGRELWVIVSNALIRGNNGEPLCFISHLLDITEKKTAQEEKRRLGKMLQQAQKMEAIGTLAGGVAHDFNNILMGIQGRASLMATDPGMTAKNRKHLSGIEDYVQRAVDLTRQLLGFARGGKYEVKTIDINRLLTKSADLFGRTKKEIEIHRKLHDGLWCVEADAGQIEQVLLNIFVNAWQAMPGGGDLSLQTENVVLDESYIKPFEVKPGRYVRLSVADTGIGMDQPTLQKIFDPFFTTKEMGRGTGLGLASAYGIVKNHNGIITAYSEKGHGTTFNIYLPASVKQPDGFADSPGPTLGGKETLLLVDDEEVILDVCRPMLESLGYRVYSAKSGEEAIEIYRKKHAEIRLTIIDLIMPGMNGGEIYDRFKEIDPEVKVLLSSGYSINGNAAEILSRGCNGFIQKPFGITELSQKIRKILDDTL